MDMRKLRKIHARAVSIDISIGGMGMVAEYPLEKGHVLVFDDEVRSEWIVARTAVVQWALQIPDEKYRVGLKFV
jgi:c-di-GMP-binding flagellar brake protein YcgR